MERPTVLYRGALRRPAYSRRPVDILGPGKPAKPGCAGLLASDPVAHLVEAGQLKSAMDRTYPLAQAVEPRESA